MVLAAKLVSSRSHKGSSSVKLVRYPAEAWLPHPKAVFQLVMFVPVIPNDGLAENIGSGSVADEKETQADPFQPRKTPADAFHLMVPAPLVDAPRPMSELSLRRPEMSSFYGGAATSTHTFCAKVAIVPSMKACASSCIFTRARSLNML